MLHFHKTSFNCFSLHFCCFFFSFIVSYGGYGQIYNRHQLDSLRSTLSDQKDIERVNTLLKLSSSYVMFQLDSAQMYADMAQEESKRLKYDWGYCKSIYCLGLIKYENAPITESRDLLKGSADWFIANRYEKDGIQAELRYASTLRCLYGLRVARDQAKITHERAVAFGDHGLIGNSWMNLMHFKPFLLKPDGYMGSYDSVRYHYGLADRPDRMMVLDLYENVRMNGTRSDFGYLYEAQRQAQKWGNTKLIYSTYWFAQQAYANLGIVDSAIYYNDLMEALESLYSKGETRLNGTRNMAYAHDRAGKIDEALAYYQEAFEQNNRYEVFSDQSGLLRAVGYVHLRSSNFELAISNFVQTLEFAERLDDEFDEHSTKLMLANLYNFTKEYETSEKLCHEVILWSDTALSGPIQNHFKGSAINTLGNVYKEKGYDDEALDYFAESIAYNEENPDYTIVNDNDIMDLFLKRDKLAAADSMYRKINEQYPEDFLLQNATFQFLKGQLLVRQGSNRDGVKALQLNIAMTKGNGYNEEGMQANFYLQKGLSALGKHEAALEAYTLYKTIEDSLQAGHEVQNVEKIQADYALSLKEVEILNLQQEKELSDLRLNQQNDQLRLRQLYIFMLIFLIVFVAVVGYLLFRRYRLKKEMEVKSKNIELQLINAEAEQKEALAQVKDTLFANISHEFRTPLTLIQVPIKSQLDKAPEQDKALLNNVLDNTEDLIRMVDELLDLAKMETGRVELYESLFRLDSFFAQIRLSFNPLFEQQKVSFQWEDLTSNLDLKGDENRLKIVMNNLLKNALAHTPHEGHVKVKAWTTPEALKITVSNSGNPISEEELPLLFDRYYRGGNQKYPGNGIGLSLSQQIVTLHGGEIHVANLEGGGVVFEVKLPAIRLSPSTKEEEELNPELEINQHPDWTAEKKHILIVEDNPEMLGLLASVLKSEFNLSFAKDGKEGEQIAFKSQPDLVLSDVMMPKQDGFELLHNLKHNLSTSHIPVVLLTAKADLQSRISGLEQNADDYISKPFSPQELMARLHNLLRQREKLQELFTKNPFLGARDIKCTPLDAEFLSKVRQILEENYMDGAFSVVDFSEKLALNRNSVHNKIKAFTNQTTSEYIKNFRLEKAAQLLLTSNESINLISIDVGFNSVQAFNKAFKKRYNCTPSAYREQQQKTGESAN